MALITLTSDIGVKDYLIGAIKGQLVQIDPAFQLVDVSHELSPFNYPQAAYVCRNAIRHFPPFTFHIILVNLFEKKPEQLLLAFHKEQYLLCADNGLLNMILEGRPEMVIGLPLDRTAVKNTLYCVRVMGQAIQQLSNGAGLLSIGIPDIAFTEKNHLRPVFGDNWIEGQIIFIDHFENVIVNITRDETIDKISETYADGGEGEKLALFNSAGYLEIAIQKGNAAGLFGLQDFTEQSQNQYLQSRLFYQTVKVFFE
jgi:S-adenosyl-L-methionine hydrolase (adenosine-forming)